MKFIQTSIPDIVLVEPTAFEDERGWFMESFNERHFQQELDKMGLPRPRHFVQDNQSCSKKGVLRGLHYQLPPYAQGKLVCVVNGAIFDVAVDIRDGSPTIGKWVGTELNSTNRRMLWIPEGFAHGFLALEKDVRVFYKTTNYYEHNSEASIRWDDPSLAIAWPPGISPITNQKDHEAPLFRGGIEFTQFKSKG